MLNKLARLLRIRYIGPQDESVDEFWGEVWEKIWEEVWESVTLNGFWPSSFQGPLGHSELNIDRKGHSIKVASPVK